MVWCEPKSSYCLEIETSTGFVREKGMWSVVSLSRVIA